MQESNKELGPLHCVYFIYYSFATTTDNDINESQIKHLITYLNEWTKNTETSTAVIKETLNWIEETSPTKNEAINIMFSMLDYLNKENIFSLLQKEALLLHIREIARSDGTFSEEEKKYHDLLAHHLGLPIRVSTCSRVEIEEGAEKVERRKIGFRVPRD